MNDTQLRQHSSNTSPRTPSSSPSSSRRWSRQVQKTDEKRKTSLGTDG